MANSKNDKEQLSEAMLQSARQRYPEFTTRSFVLPIMHFDRVIYRPVRRELPGFSFVPASSPSDSRLWTVRPREASGRLGMQTEDSVSRLFAELTKDPSQGPLMILLNYKFGDYLCILPLEQLQAEKGAGEKMQQRRAEVSDGNPAKPVQAAAFSDQSQGSEKGCPDDKESVVTNAPDNEDMAVPTETEETQNKLATIIESADLGERTQSTKSLTMSEGETASRGLQAKSKPGSISDRYDEILAHNKELDRKAEARVQKALFPRPQDFEAETFRQGEVDVLLISPTLGLIDVEIKTMKDRKMYPDGDKEESEKGSKDLKQKANTQTSVLLPQADSHAKSTDDDPSSSVPERNSSLPGASSSLAERISELDLQGASSSLAERNSSLHGASSSLAERISELDLQGADTSDSGVLQWKTDLQRTVLKALTQLKKNGLVLSYLTSDISPGLRTSKVLAFPGLSMTHLVEAFKENSSLLEAACTCMEVSSLQEVLQHCLCAEQAGNNLDLQATEAQVDDPDRRQDPESDPTSNGFQTWWTALAAGLRGESNRELSLDAYEQLVARFCGKYSRLEGHSVADCIHLTGVKFGRSILTQEQLDILDCTDPFVYLSGPPGSGKTLLMGLKAVEWAKAGDLVAIVCCEGVNTGSLVSWQLYRRVLEALGWKEAADDDQASPSGGGLPLPGDSPAAASSGDGDGGGRGEGTREGGGGNARTGPKGKKPRRKKPKPPRPAGKVLLKTISRETDLGEFIKEITAQKNEGNGIRVIFDEVLKEVTEESQLNRLKNSLRTLASISETYQTIFQLLNNSASDPKTEPPRRSDGQACRELFNSMSRRLEFMAVRLANLTPATLSAGPRLMHTDDWFRLLAELKEVHKKITQACAQLQEPVKKAVETGAVDAGCAERPLMEIDQLMRDSMGYQFHAYNLLLFFQADTLFRTMRETASTPSHAPVSVWCSSIYPAYRPEGFTVQQLTRCVRCPPNVQKIMSLTANSDQAPPEHRYALGDLRDDPPYPVDGPKVRFFDHASHMRSHTLEVNDCSACGHVLADYLLSDLHIDLPPLQHKENPPTLKIEDVIITGSPIHQPQCAFVQALRDRGINIQFETPALTSPPPYPGMLLIMGGATLLGLEAKIVVYLPEVSRMPEHVTHVTEEAHLFDDLEPQVGDWRLAMRPEEELIIERMGRWNKEFIWNVASRSLAHLVIFYV